MKQIALIVLLLMVTGMAYAEPVITESKDAEGNHVFTVTISAREYKTLLWQSASPVHWVWILINNIVTSSRERMLLKLTDKRINTLSKEEGDVLIDNSNLKTRAERRAEALEAIRLEAIQ